VSAPPLTFRLAARIERARLLRWRARAHRLLSFLLRLVVRLEVSGLENIPRHGPVIFAANHVNSALPVRLPAARLHRHHG